MRVANQLPAMTTDKARLKKNKEIKSPNCVSCHQAYSFATTPIEAGVNACLNCHADEHSLAYKKSPHFQLVQQAQFGHSDQNADVSCVSCIYLGKVGVLRAKSVSKCNIIKMIIYAPILK